MNKHLDILLVEDSEDDAVLLLREIKKGGYDPNFVRVETAEDMLSCFNEQTWDIVISDYSLPEFSAPEALKVLQETGLDLPFIIVSGKVEDEVAVECMTAGAQDFIRKDNMVRLIPAIERELNEAIVRKKRKEAEDALQESEERFRTLYSAMNEGVAIHEMIYDEAGEPVDYRILNVNPVFESITGIKIEDVIGVRASELYGTGEAPYLNIYAKVATSGESVTFESTFEPMDKTFKISVFSPDKGKFATLFADITERKRSEKEIVKLSRFNKSIITSIPVGIVTMDQVGKITSANDNFLEIVGSPSLEETLKLGIHTHSVEAVGISKAVKNILMTGRSFDMNEIPYTSHWGKEVIINLRGVPLKDIDGNITGVVLIIDDVTDMAKAEEALIKSEEKFRNFFELSADMVCIADIDGYFRQINDSWQRVMGHSKEELLSKPFMDYIHPDDKAMTMNIIVEKLKHGETALSFENRYICKDGSIVWLEWISQPQVGTDLTFAIARDITKRKQTQEQLKISAEELARSNEKLKSLDKMKDEFLSNVSHELKTPLISIQGFTEVMQDELYGPLNDKQKKAMDTVLRNSERLGRLINSILYLTLQKSGRDTYTTHPVNITEIIGNAIIDISPQANSKDLTIENNTQSDLPLIKGDMDKLTQVFINLIENAIKFTPNGGKITMAAFEDGENIHNTVTDTGIGVSADVISNLFERFYQVDASTTRHYGGTGIGLYISKLIVEVHKGRIWAESEEGIGTTFHVVLPK